MITSRCINKGAVLVHKMSPVDCPALLSAPACPLSVCCRVKKLKETLATVQQLDKNMSNLRSWLSGMEAELSRPITYSVCHHQEIQRRLAEQQVSRKRSML